MDSILAGLCFILLDFTLIFPTRTVALIPDFIGYLLLYRGLKELMEKAPALARLHRWSCPLAVGTGTSWLLFILGVLPSSGTAVLLLRSAAAIAALWGAWQTATGIRQMEESYHIELEAVRLRRAWWWMAGTVVVVFLLPERMWILRLIPVALTLRFLRLAAHSFRFYRARRPGGESFGYKP
ncbi:MAG: hypothetical protein VB086_05680 [Clostridiaceae bacterium]|nr:hypothetical protein [Clostridiaceae bacterium]